MALTDSDDGSADGDDREAGEPLGDLARAHVLRPHLHVGLEHVVQDLRENNSIPVNRELLYGQLLQKFQTWDHKSGRLQATGSLGAFLIWLIRFGRLN